MSLKFETVSLGEHLYIKGRIGWKGLKKDEYLDQGDYRIINATALEEEGINWEDCGYISKERFEESPEIILKNKDILISKDGTIGKLGYVKNLEMDSTVASGIFVVRNQNEEYIDTDFLYYYFKSPFFKWFIKSVTEGSVIPHLYQRDFIDMEFNLFELNIQRKCSSILNAIEEKINVNRKINKNLEDLMQVLYKRYFIEMNPFYADNDEEWKIIKLKDLVIRNRDKIKTFDEWKDELLIDLSNMPRFSIAISNFDKGEKFTSNIYRLNKYDLLFGSIRPYFGKVGFSPINGVVTGTVHSFKPVADIYYSLILSLISSKTFINYTVSVSKGTKMPSVKWEDFIDYEFAIPENINKIEEYNCLVLPLIHKIENNVLEIQRLTNLRDTLLPKLMSGEIDVSKINCDL